MKTLAVIFTAMIVSLSTGLYANNEIEFKGDVKDVKVNLELKKDNQVSITIESLIDKALVLEVYDNKGNQVMRKLINEHKTQKVLHNTNDIEAGFFTYMVKNGDEIVYTSRIIKGNDGSLEFRSEDSGVNASIERTGDDLVLVRMFKDEDAKATIKVWDEDGNYVYRKDIRNGKNLRLTHSIKEFPEGTYSFGVFHDGEMIALRNITK